MPMARISVNRSSGERCCSSRPMANPAAIAPRWVTNWMRAMNEPRSAAVVTAPTTALKLVMAMPRARWKPTTLTTINPMPTSGRPRAAASGANRIGTIRNWRAIQNTAMVRTVPMRRTTARPASGRRYARGIKE